jgi:formylglycine-generating enzyme required for sulfatase activity
MSMESDPFRMLKPIRCVDWCDAQAFCLWAGGELCGGWTDGQFVGPSDVHDQWGLACSGANGWSYVSGTTAVLEQCNVGLSEAGLCPSLLGQNNCAPTDATSFPECKSPCGAVNMIGSVAEWVLSCGNPDADGGPGTECQYRGGSFAENLNDATCFPGPRHTMSISTRDRGIGLRCCAALTVDERNHLK